MRRAFAFVFFAVLAPARVFAAGPKIVFLPLWSPQAQFAGYFMAAEKGFYAGRGLDVALLAGGPDQPVNDWLKEGRADIAVLWLSEAVQLRAQGAPVVNVAQMSQRSALRLVAKKSTGVRRPEDLEGRKVGLWDSFQVQPRAYFKRQGLRVKPITQSHSVDLFLRGGVDAASAMLYNEYHTILNSGIDENELTVFHMEGPGLDFPEDGIYVREELWTKRPKDVCRFVAASLDGWRYAFDHQEETLDVVLRRMQKAGISADRVHQRWMLKKMRGLFTDREGRLLTGRLNFADYRRVTETLREEGLRGVPAPYEAFVQNCDDQK